MKIIISLEEDGTITMVNNEQRTYTERAQYVEPIAPDACEGCDATSCRKIEELQQDCKEWKATAQAATRNAFYWREELSKLQKESMDDTTPISEVAKIYVQISPAVLAQITSRKVE